MFIVGNLLIAAGRVLELALNIYLWIVVVRALISWVNPDPYNPIVRLLTRLTEPVLLPMRRMVPTWRMGFDLSPMIAIAGIYFINLFLVRTIINLGFRLR